MALKIKPGKVAHLSISVIVPVLEEEKSINSVLDHLKLQTAGYEGDVEFIVVDGSENCGTLDAIDQNGVMKISSSRGRGAQMNRGAKAAKGDVLLFLHADTQLPPSAFHTIEAAMAGSAVAGAFSLVIDSEKPFLKFISWVTTLRSKLTRIPYGDQAIFIKRDYFHRIGHYKSIPIMEDVELMERVRKNGERIVILDQQVVTSARRWEKDGFIRRTLRNRFISMLYSIGVSPEKLIRFY